VVAWRGEQTEAGLLAGAGFRLGAGFSPPTLFQFSLNAGSD